MAVEAEPAYPIYEEIEKKRDVAYALKLRIENGESDVSLLKQYFAAERDFRHWAYRTVDPHNPYQGQKNMEREAKEYDNLLKGGLPVWAAFCEKWSNGLKKWIRKHNIQGKEKDEAETQANNLGLFAAKLREE